MALKNNTTQKTLGVPYSDDSDVIIKCIIKA